MVKYNKNINKRDDELNSLWNYLSHQLLQPGLVLDDRLEMQKQMFQLDQMYEFVLSKYQTSNTPISTQSLVEQLLFQSTEAEEATVNIDSPMSA